MIISYNLYLFIGLFIHKAMESNKFKFNLLGNSTDYRTNRWQVTCKSCDNSFEPSTTMMAIQTIRCNKCNEEELINYNKLKL
jgi:hypothetical protein